MVTHHQNDTGEFAARKASTSLEPNRVQPHLGSIGIPLDVHVHWLVSIASEEEEPIRTNPKDRGHGE